MNIFVTDPSPIKSAQYLDDKRAVKMILESAQMLSTAIYSVSGIREGIKPTHINHPCNLWVRASRANYQWLYEHFCALMDEKLKRFPERPPHKYECYREIYKQYINIFPDEGLTPFVNCAASKAKNLSFTHIKNTFTAYKLYLCAQWEMQPTAPKFYRVSY